MTEKKWFLVDAKDKVVGRLATQIATVLIGKNKRTYTPGTDNGCLLYTSPSPRDS